MLQIPTQPLPNQIFRVTIGEQNCSIELRSFNGSLYASVSVDGVYHATNRICLTGVALVGAKYLGFKGNLMFIDTQGEKDPTYDGLGSRYLLMYFEESELV